MEPVGVRFAAGDGDRSWRGELRALSKAPPGTLRRVSYPTEMTDTPRRWDRLTAESDPVFDAKIRT